jgi:magnesium-transporting ATPase (P-type)
MIVRKAWLPKSSVYTVRDSKNPNDPTAGYVTYSEAQSDIPKDEKRDYDLERTTHSIKFDVPDEKANPPRKEEHEPKAEITPELRMFLLSAALCNLATVRYDEGEGKWQTTGEPTEIALQVFARRFDFGRKSLKEAGWKQIAEFSFDSTIKRMTVVYNAPGTAEEYGLTAQNSHVFTKGAVERVLDLCSHIGIGDAREEVTEEVKERVLAQMSNLASQGQRVLAVAYREWDGLYTEHENPNVTNDDDDPVRLKTECHLTLLGLAGIYDPPRRETTPAISECAS